MLRPAIDFKAKLAGAKDILSGILILNVFIKEAEHDIHQHEAKIKDLRKQISTFEELKRDSQERMNEYYAV